MSFPKVSVRRSSIDGDTTDMAVLEFNVKDEVVQESFIDQSKQSSLHLEKALNLEKVMKKIKKFKPNNSLVKRLQNEPKNTNQAKINTPLIQKPSQSSVLQLRNCSNINDSNVRSKTTVYLQPLRITPTRFQVHLQPITVPKGKTCFLIRTLPSKPLLPIKSPVKISYKAGP